MRQTVVDFLSVPKDLRQEYWQDTVQKNRLSLFIICIMIVGMELFNMARVLFMSSAKLGTLNNRIYFGLYCSLFLVGLLFLIFFRPMRKLPVRAQWGLQCGVLIFTFLWHAGINAYDLLRDPNNGTSIVTTAILGLAVFIQAPALYSTLCIAAGYALFLALAGHIIEPGDLLNFTITAIVALAMSMTRSHSAVIRLRAHREIARANEQLHELLQKDPLTGLLNRAAFQRCAESLLKDPAQSGALTMLIADLDDFKAINDHYGHPAGDAVLCAAAKALSSAFPHAAGIGRLGGDEFSVLLCGPITQEVLEARTRELLAWLSAITWQGLAIRPSCSVGGCAVRLPGPAYDQIYTQADNALYEAKRQGKGLCVLNQL